MDFSIIKSQNKILEIEMNTTNFINVFALLYTTFLCFKAEENVK